MVANREGPQPLFYPADVAQVLGKSAWWVKDQARKGLIPFTKPGRAYRFTAEQIAEIVRLYARPAPVPAQLSVRAVIVPPDRPAGPATTKPAVRLRARPPRRAARSAVPQTEAA
ncbi:helix-turn-helix domain-containing protein [Kitasatospora purpeofusca]|uniref:helix-turn-helix domain-containing protein n=1 Tax=Kitasatospora purpeofusca TaxID=67352 RepID=UPI0038630F12|nr:helix-turn-helix domain-containing protein [Kitasatospora purpeofusca]